MCFIYVSWSGESKYILNFFIFNFKLFTYVNWSVVYFSVDIFFYPTLETSNLEVNVMHEHVPTVLDLGQLLCFKWSNSYCFIRLSVLYRYLRQNKDNLVFQINGKHEESTEN